MKANKSYQICSVSVMDTTDPEITFNEDGVSNHVLEYQEYLENIKPDKQKANELKSQMLEELKKSGKHKDYDCIIGLSGGVDRLDAQKAGVDSLNRLAEFAKPFDVSILVENHGGFSSDGSWLSNVMQNVSRENIGTLPDFGNFCIERKEQECISAYDRYQGMSELMPFAKALSAKSHAFNEQGNETQSDFFRMIEIAKKSQYSGYVGIEFEGTMDSEEEGIIKTKNLLDKAIAASY